MRSIDLITANFADLHCVRFDSDLTLHCAKFSAKTRERERERVTPPKMARI